MPAQSLVKSKSRDLLIGFKYGVFATSGVGVDIDVSAEPNARGNYTMVMSDKDDEGGNSVVVITQGGAEGTHVEDLKADDDYPA